MQHLSKVLINEGKGQSCLPSFELDAKDNFFGGDTNFDSFSLACLEMSYHNLVECFSTPFVHGKCWQCHIHLST